MHAHLKRGLRSPGIENMHYVAPPLICDSVLFFIAVYGTLLIQLKLSFVVSYRRKLRSTRRRQSKCRCSNCDASRYVRKHRWTNTVCKFNGTLIFIRTHLMVLFPLVGIIYTVCVRANVPALYLNIDSQHCCYCNCASVELLQYSGGYRDDRTVITWAPLCA